MIHANDNHTGLRFLSVCSGIEAASCAWHPLGWKAVAFSEIEKFPSAVLAHHYPDVPNLGDFTKIDVTTLGRVDILAGGTPCQAFSVAGLRQSLADARGNLSLEFVRLAHELADNNGLRNAVWENVVGVLSTKDNAFGCFLAGLVGADSAIEPPRRGKWGGAGMVSGPKGTAAWRVLDAQYFGVAQRRRRVIVVADFGNGADPAAVLFEQDGVRRYSPPSREAGKDVAPTISARTKGGGGLGTDFDLDGGLVEYAIQAGALRTNPTSGPGGVGVQERIAYTLEARAEVQAVYAPEIARCVATREGSSQDYETTTMVAVDVAPTMRAGGNKTGGDRPYGTDVDTCDSLAICVHGTQDPCVDEYLAFAMRRNSGQENVVAFVQNSRDEVRLMGGDGSIVGALAAEPGAKQQCYLAQSVAIRGRDGGATAELGGEVATALRASQGGGDKPHVQTFAVRRLTPVECERLQGFPDDYTLIPWRGKPADQCPDGPRYKALGNSWAVPKFAWLGKRIVRFMPNEKPAAASGNDNDGMRDEKVAA
ncbi:DNA cytosine methyltransferase [Rhizobium phaseoli]|uniref:DNA cytosine methyltransferase n=1 Tax=Rhizobium phaseoli TaxID=396 RepID=UPI00255423A1|nr:DNA cytosine methyltransferase [Rhizobium phaseoli]MDK4727452.1 DNA cytosine methyltransferase [Rhizobium phaseoli]